MAVLDNTIARREKRWAAGSSVLGAVTLTFLKVIVGLMTGSLGILAEAAHSALDLGAALVTLFAVRASDKPADDEHLYGHGKIENLSALFETVLLLITCAWIVYEAMHRLVAEQIHVDASIWAFGVMVVSILVDVSRSRVLYRAARKYNSQALEADALHFSTDIWSSSVVILGLVGVRLGDMYPQHGSWLSRADSVAALGVALIVIYVSLRLGKRTLQALLDTAPAGLPEQIRTAVNAVPGASGCHHVRVRPSGPGLFVDIHVYLDGNTTLTSAHDLTEAIEKRIGELAPGADVTVHPEPRPPAKIGGTRPSPEAPSPVQERE
ncbi:MAG: cation diffusion facilitator family transporter [Phycisphaerae bacterium]|nr:cation diffusion facilitator family transporter [Phycisphaerae bacterium]